MAAALRIAGRRLIGAQRPQSEVVCKAVVSPLVDEGRRRLLPSLLRGGRQPGFSPLRSMSSTSRGADAHPPKFNQQPSAEPDPVLDPEGAWAYRRIVQIETKKHELFYLLGDMIKRYPGREYSKINNELPHNLFPHITPNPDDPVWRYCRMKERISNSVLYGVPTLMATWMYLDWDSWRNMFIDLLSRT